MNSELSEFQDCLGLWEVKFYRIVIFEVRLWHVGIGSNAGDARFLRHDLFGVIFGSDNQTQHVHVILHHSCTDVGMACSAEARIELEDVQGCVGIVFDDEFDFQHSGIIEVFSNF